MKSMNGILLPVKSIDVANKIVKNRKVRTRIFLFFENNTDEKIKKKEKLRIEKKNVRR